MFENILGKNSNSTHLLFFSEIYYIINFVKLNLLCANALNLHGEKLNGPKWMMDGFMMVHYVCHQYSYTVFYSLPNNKFLTRPE